MQFHEQLGLRPIINASGMVTRLGGARVPREVQEAYLAAWQHPFPIEQVQNAACRAIADCTRAEAGIVTCGAAAALTLGAAAIMTGLHVDRMELLPDTSSFPHEFVVARSQRNGYDHAVRAAGARLVEVGFDEMTAHAGVRRTELRDYEAGIGDQTAGILYFYAETGAPALAEVVQLAHAYQLPVLVDAAAQLPPRENLELAAQTGADLVCFSGGKAIQGPQGTGILCGRRPLVAAALLQMIDLDELWELWEPPEALLTRDEIVGLPRHGLGRAMKVSKESIVALISALQLFVQRQPAERAEEQRRLLHGLKETLNQSPLTCRLVDFETERPRLEIVVHAHNALEVARKLRQGDPQIYVGTGHVHEQALMIDPSCLDRPAVSKIGERLREIVDRDNDE